jgi:hypothetical protein
MTLARTQYGLAFLSLLALAPSVRGEGLLITCSAADTCDFRAVASLSVNGKAAIRGVLAKTIQEVTVGALRASRDRKIDELTGLVRDPVSGQIFTFSPNAEAPEMVFPPGSAPKDAAMIPGLWNAAKIGSRDSLKSKTEMPVATQSLAAYLNGSDLKEVAIAYARTLLSETPPPVWKTGLLRGAVRFGASAPSYKAWRDQLFTSSKDALDRYRKQEGDPRRMEDALTSSIRDGEILVQIAPEEPSYAVLLKDARNEREILEKKVSISRAFLAGSYWDEAVLKVRELGLAKWSFSDLATGERSALINSSTAHKATAEEMERSGLLDRAFDEAERAYRQDPCNAEVSVYFNSVRPQFVERNKDPRQGDTAAASRPEMEQLERQLRSFDPAQLQQDTYRKLGYDLIKRGDAVDRTYVPFQLAKAQFLRNVGRLSDALDVVIDVERHFALDPQQRDQWLSLDANLSLTLSAIRDKALADATSNFDAGRFAPAVDATTVGLAANPNYPPLLVQKAYASASLRQSDEALGAIGTLLQSSNPACAEPSAYEKAFSLRDVLQPASSGGASQTVSQNGAPNGIPNWMSGEKYNPGRLYYDPISLSFVPRIVAIDGDKAPSVGTSFTWDGLRLVNIETKVSSQKKDAVTSDPGQTIFFVEAEYASNTLRMTAIAPRALQDGKRISYPLTFWNDPKVNIGLLQATGRAAARGWAGNPVFDPFVWTGIFLFDFKYDDKGRVIQATPVPDETRGRSFFETLNFVWEDSTNRLKEINSKSYRRTLKYDTKGRLVSEEAVFGKLKATTSYEYAGNNVSPLRATSNSVFDRQQRAVFFQPGN